MFLTKCVSLKIAGTTWGFTQSNSDFDFVDCRYNYRERELDYLIHFVRGGCSSA